MLGNGPQTLGNGTHAVCNGPHALDNFFFFFVFFLNYFCTRGQGGSVSPPQVFYFMYIIGRVPGFEPEMLRLQPGVLPLSYTHPLLSYTHPLELHSPPIYFQIKKTLVSIIHSKTLKLRNYPTVLYKYCCYLNMLPVCTVFTTGK